MKKYLFVLSAIVLFAFSGCKKIAGDPIDKVFTIEGSYTALEVGDAFDVTVSNAVDAITVTAGENVMPNVVVEKVGNTLKIHLKPLATSYGSEMKVMLPYNEQLTSVNMSGASEFHSEYGLDGQTVEVELSGASTFYCTIEADEVDVQLSGASDYFGEVTATDVDIDLSGASDFSGDITATEIDMDLSGGSTIKSTVTATELDLDLTGASDATFMGQATLLKINLTGASTIAKTVAENRYGFACENVEGVMSGASSAYLHCDGNIKVNLSGASDLHYTGEGNPADSSTSGGSDITHDLNP